MLFTLKGITVRKEGEGLVIARILTGSMIERQGDDRRGNQMTAY